MTSRPVRVTACRTCGARTLTGLDADVLAFVTVLDSDPVDELGEVLALMQGRRTFDLRRTAGREGHGQRMELRNAYRISTALAAPQPVHAEHRCHQPLPAAVTPPKETTVSEAWPDPRYAHLAF